MKKSTLIFIAAIFVIGQGIGQVPLLRYQPNVLVLRKNPVVGKVGTDSSATNKDGKTNIVAAMVPEGVYATQAKRFDDMYSQKKYIADSSFKADFNKLQPPADGGSIASVYDAQRDNLIKKYKIDLLNARYYHNEAETYRYLDRTTGNFNAFWKKGGFVNNANDAQMFYNQQIGNNKVKLMNTSLITFGTGGSTASIYNELFADFFGPVRVGIGALLNNQSSSSAPKTAADSAAVQNDAIQRLLGGGANGVLSASYPLLSYQDNSNAFNIKMFVSPKFGADVPKIGTVSDSYAYNYDLGADLGAYYSGVLDVITFYSHIRTSYLGGNEQFYAGLNKPDKRAFWLNQLSIGVAVTNVFTFSWNSYFGDPFVNRHFSNTLSVTVSPN